MSFWEFSIRKLLPICLWIYLGLISYKQRDGMKKIIVIYLQCIAVMISIFVGFQVYRRFNPEAFSGYTPKVVGLKEIEQYPGRIYCCGKIAGRDIPQLTRAEELKGLNGYGKSYTEYEYITVVTEEIIGTNIYGRVPWVDPETLKLKDYRLDKYYFPAAKPEVIEEPAIRVEAYQEYYLVKLPDSSYVLARFSPVYARKVKMGEVALPVGLVTETSVEARTYLEGICSVYGANPAYVIDMIDEEWGLENHLKFFLLRLGVAISAYILVGVGLVLAVEKLFEEKAKKE